MNSSPHRNDTPTQSIASMPGLATETNRITAVIPPGARVGFIDYPMHTNVGDLLIFLGAMDFFAANGNPMPVSFCLYDATPSAWAALETVDVIACHGGGNFGDIYPKHQRLREEALRRFPHKPIVVMPQSIHFSSDETMRASAALFRAHDNVTVCVRDQESEAVAKQHFTDRVLLMPDMAHRLYETFAPVRATADGRAQEPFWLMRRDVEAVPGRNGDPRGADWKTMLRLTDKLRMERHRSASRLRGLLNGADANAVQTYRNTVLSIVMALAGRIGHLNPWTTTRLHGAIFGLLLDRDVTLLDNSYGKNSRYFRQWDPEQRLLSIASSVR